MSQVIAERKWHWRLTLFAALFVLGFVVLVLHELGIWTPLETPIHNSHMWISEHLATVDNWRWS